VPGVNNLKSFGRWDFVELGDVFAIEEAFGELVLDFKSKTRELEVA
jgi:type III restriction enzyme